MSSDDTSTEPPSVRQETRFRTFLFADIRGYTRYTQEHGDDGASALAGRFAGSVREAVAGFDGELLELRGDEALCVFSSARQALGAAIELQRRLRTPTTPDRIQPLASIPRLKMTKQGQQAIANMPRALATNRVFHIDGRPISWRYFHQDIWGPALQSAGLAPRPPYSLRHTFAYLSLRAGVPIAILAREMGHATTEQTFRVYGGMVPGDGRRRCENTFGLGRKSVGWHQCGTRHC